MTGCSDSPWTILGGYQRGWPRSRYLKYLELITSSHKYQQFQIFPRAFWNWQRKVLPAICGDYPRYRHPFRCQNLPPFGANTFACTVSMCNKHVNICFCIFVTFLCVKIQCNVFMISPILQFKYAGICLLFRCQHFGGARLESPI